MVVLFSRQTIQYKKILGNENSIIDFIYSFVWFNLEYLKCRVAQH